MSDVRAIRNVAVKAVKPTATVLQMSNQGVQLLGAASQLPEPAEDEAWRCARPKHRRHGGESKELRSA
jgi:hypothetical protein